MSSLRAALIVLFGWLAFWFVTSWAFLRLIWGTWGFPWIKYHFFYQLADILYASKGKQIPANIATNAREAIEEIKLLDPMYPSIWLFIAAALGGLVVMVVLLKIIGKSGPITKQHEKGVGRVKPKEFAKMAAALLKDKRARKGIMIHPTVPMVMDAETEHFAVIGTTGAGKTKGILNSIFKQAKDRGDKVVLWDVKGDFSECLVGDRDVMLVAPWDARSVQWDIAADIDKPSDCDMIAQSAIPDDPNDSKPFRSHARAILSALMQCLHADGALNWADLGEFIYDKKLAIQLLSRYPVGREVLSYFQDDSPQSQATVSTLHDHAGKWIRKAGRAWPEPSFSVRKWIKDPNQKGTTLVLRYHAEYPELSGAMCAMVTSLLIQQLLAMPEDGNHENPVWFIMDEMANFPKVESLKRGITLARDRGGRFVISAQDVTQLYPVYGKELTKTLINQCNTQIWLRSNDGENAKFASDCLGTREEMLHVKGTSKSKEGSKQSESDSYNLRTVPVVMPGEIMALSHARNIKGGGAHGFIKMGGVQSVCDLVWPLTFLEKKGPAEVTADWVYARETAIE